MKSIYYTFRFKKDFNRLPKEIKNVFQRQVELLLSNPDHPSLDLKKMQDPRNIWRIKVTGGYRVTFQLNERGYLLRGIGPHDVERKP